MKQLKLDFTPLKHLPPHTGIVSINWNKAGTSAKSYTVILKRLSQKLGGEWFTTTEEKTFTNRHKAYAHKELALNS